MRTANEFKSLPPRNQPFYHRPPQIAKSGMEADALRHVIASIDAYLHGGATVYPFEICEALLAKTQSRSRGSDVSQDAVPEQKYIPFIGSVCVGSPLQEGTASGTSLGGVQQHGTEALSELQLDYWTMPSPTDKKAKEKQSSVKATFQHLSVMRQGGLDPRGTSKVAFALEGTVRDRKGGLLELGHGKKHEKHKKGDKIAFVKALTSKLVCTAKSKISIRGAWMHDRELNCLRIRFHHGTLLRTTSDWWCTGSVIVNVNGIRFLNIVFCFRID